jgi:hypothetical protein
LGIVAALYIFDDFKIFEDFFATFDAQKILKI